MAEETNISRNSRPRPLSPHLQVYKPQFTSALSIFHRASIIGMYIGVLGLVVILADYAFVQQCACANFLKSTEAGQIITKLVLSIFALVASYWLCATIRHLLWDMGIGFEINTAYKTAVLTIVATFALTILIIYYGKIW